MEIFKHSHPALTQVLIPLGTRLSIAQDYENFKSHINSKVTKASRTMAHTITEPHQIPRTLPLKLNTHKSNTVFRSLKTGCWNIRSYFNCKKGNHTILQNITYLILTFTIYSFVLNAKVSSLLKSFEIHT